MANRNGRLKMMNVNKAEFRFYEELNDFLHPSKRKKPFIHYFRSNPTVKVLIGVLGVPHVEVDLILANGEPVDFAYRLKDGDHISVYPIFETFDISGIKGTAMPALRKPEFILDVHLGRLARYLRMLGFDSIYRNDMEDMELVELSLQEHRILLTRDRELLKQEKLTHGLWLRSAHPKQQAREIITRLDLCSIIHPFSRCMDCNGMIEKVEKRTVLSMLQPGTFRTFDEYFRCTSCGKVYWKGAHYQRMERILSEITRKEGSIPGQGGPPRSIRKVH